MHLRNVIMTDGAINWLAVFADRIVFWMYIKVATDACEFGVD